ncbi:MAG: PQQ-binding-like beta-propeller repeat protein [Nitriliruptoraceae bacterium]
MTPSDATEPHRDPMASDRRVLIIGLVAMLLFVTVGVTSASVFTASACRDVAATDAVAFDAAGITAVAAGNIDDLADVDPLAADDLATLETLAGPATAAMWLPAERYQPHALASHDAGRWLLRGASSIVELVERANQVTVPVDATLVGSGDTLFAVALTNLLTGQVDAVQPVTVDGAAAGCIDTALARVPLAFYLDASDGQMVLLRVDEAGQQPEIELLNADGTIAWRSPVTSPVGPPGVLGERITAAAGGTTIVAGRRFVAGDDAGVVALYDRHDGAIRWEFSGTKLMPLVTPSAAYRTTALAVGDAHAYVALAPDDTADDDVTVVAISVDSGEIEWTATLPAVPTWAAAVDTTLLASLDGQLWTIADGVATAVGVSGVRHLTYTDGLQVLLDRQHGTLALSW